MVTIAQIFGHEICALIDNGVTWSFISPTGVTKYGLMVESHNTFLELGDGTKVISRGRAINVPIVTSGYLMKIDLTVCSLLRKVDPVLGMTWLVEADLLIRWSIGSVYLPGSILSSQWIMGDFLDKQVKVGTVKVLSTNEELESLRKPSNTASLKVLESLAFWVIKSEDTQHS